MFRKMFWSTSVLIEISASAFSGSGSLRKSFLMFIVNALIAISLIPGSGLIITNWVFLEPILGEIRLFLVTPY